MQSSQPLVSVVIPCYNHEQFVQDAIQSVIDQTYNNIELIPVDGIYDTIKKEHLTQTQHNVRIIRVAKKNVTRRITENFNSVFRINC